jgi:hypothetical protein
VVGGELAGLRVRGCRRPVKAAQGQGCCALGDWTRGWRGDVAARLWWAEPLLAWLWGQRGLFPLGDSPGEHARAAARRPGQPGGAAVPSGACTGATGRAHTGVEREKVRG